MSAIILPKTRRNILEPVRKAYTKSLRQLRAKLGYTQEAISEELGCDYTTYGKIEKGTIGLTVERAIRLSVIFNVSLEELLNFEDLKRDPEFSGLVEGRRELLIEEPSVDYGHQSDKGLHLHINIGDTSKNDTKANDFMDRLTELMKTIKPEDLD